MELHYCKHGVGGHGGGCLQCRAEKAEAELARLRALCERLAGYTRHSGECDKSYPAYSEFKVKCSCGMDALLEEAAGRGEGEK